MNGEIGTPVEIVRERLAEAMAERRGKKPAVSADRRRTEKRHAALAAGRHPFMGGPVRPDLGTCGDCAHSGRQGGVAGSYYKCALNLTGGPATDIRISWPACNRFEVQS